MTRKEIQNILKHEWMLRRQRLQERRRRNSQQCKEWKKREKKIKNGELPEPLRQKHYLD